MSVSHKAILRATFFLLACTAPHKNGLISQIPGAQLKADHRWTQWSVTYDPGMGGICTGGSTIQLLELPGDRAVQERINAIIMDEVNAALNNDSAYSIPASAFYAGKLFAGDSAVYNWDTRATLLTDSNGVASFELVTNSNCGGSISDPTGYTYFTVDLTTGRRVDFAEIIDTLSLATLAIVVQAYARQHRVDNVQYLGEHDPSKLVYLAALDDRYILTREHIGVFLRVRDDNEPDWGRRAREGETIGEEWMRVDVPKGRLRNFVRVAYRKRLL